jgi:predicted kinase
MGQELEETTDRSAGESELPAALAKPGQDGQVLADRLTRPRDTSRMLPKLKEELEGLPIGHPSSPRNEDGSRRAPEASLKDIELLIPPLTDAQWADHSQEVTGRLDKALAEGLSTDALHTIDPKHQIWTPERNRQHAVIIEEVYGRASNVPCDRLAIMAGGLPGAGKTTVLEHHAGIDRSKYLMINPDDFKEELARRGMLPEIPGLTPMEVSSLAHRESSYLARRLAMRAVADGKNVIWDISMSSIETTSRRIDELRDAEYVGVDALFVDIPIETSVARAEARHRDGHDRYLADEGLGGRPVIPDIIRSQADPEHGSVNRRAFEALKDRFDHWAVYDNSVDGRPPVLVKSSEDDLSHEATASAEESVHEQ